MYKQADVLASIEAQDALWITLLDNQAVY